VVSGNTAYGHSNTFGCGISGFVRNHESRYAVVKYLPEDSPPAEPPQGRGQALGPGTPEGSSK
jgi:hypothetical protein